MTFSSSSPSLAGSSTTSSSAISCGLHSPLSVTQHPWLSLQRQRLHLSAASSVLHPTSPPPSSPYSPSLSSSSPPPSSSSPAPASPALLSLSSSPSLSPSLPSSTPYFAHMDEFEHDPSLSFEKAMIAGAAAGVMEHLAMFPVDTIKTNMQVALPITSPQPHHPLNLLQTTRLIIREQGVLRLYRGVTAVVIGAIPSHAVNYASYEFFKRKFGGDQPGHHVVANAVAGALATMAHDAVITPLDVVKQRLQVVDSRYTGVLQCVRAILREEGMSAFYASYPTTVLMNIPFMAVQFAGYESFKLLLTGMDRAEEHGVAEELIAGGLAGASAGFLSTPLDVVKTRIQTQGGRGPGVQAVKAMEVMRRIWQREGARGFMRGASARVLYFMPSAAICWTTYETVKRALKRAW